MKLKLILTPFALLSFFIMPLSAHADDCANHEGADLVPVTMYQHFKSKTTSSETYAITTMLIEFNDTNSTIATWELESLKMNSKELICYEGGSKSDNKTKGYGCPISKITTTSPQTISATFKRGTSECTTSTEIKSSSLKEAVYTGNEGLKKCMFEYFPIPILNLVMCPIITGIGEGIANVLSDAVVPNILNPDTGDKTGGIDGDGIPVLDDNCPDVYNPNQDDNDLDGKGDACDAFDDPREPDISISAEDVDGDSISNSIDNCEEVANPDQADLDNDGIGDACDDDMDGDGIVDTSDNCPLDFNPQQDNINNCLIKSVSDPLKGLPATAGGGSCQLQTHGTTATHGYMGLIGLSLLILVGFRSKYSH